MTAPDLRPALDWLSVVADAVAAGRPWQADSARHLRTLPAAQASTPALLACVLAGWQRRGLPPAAAVGNMQQLLDVMALHWGPDA